MESCHTEATSRVIPTRPCRCPLMRDQEDILLRLPLHLPFNTLESQKMDAGALLWKGSYRITHTANQPGKQGKDRTLSPGCWCQRDSSPPCGLSFCSYTLIENGKDVYCFLQRSPDWRMSSLSHRICHMYKIRVSVQSRISK